MTDLKFYLLCIMIAAPQGALGSAAKKFVEKWVDEGEYYKSLTTNRFIPDVESDSKECFSVAVTKGAQAVLAEVGCVLAFLSHPICNQKEGEWHLYVQKDFLTDGSPSDNATYNVRFYQQVLPVGYVIRTFRIESPTILEFGDVYLGQDPMEKRLKYFGIIMNENFLYHSKSPAFMDPKCYSTSACSVVFLTIAPEIPESEILILYDVCGQSIQVDSGKSFYVISHEGIGCKNFPNDYPVPDCWAEFTAAGEITINVTFVNFRESDQCDGFTMTAVTDDANGSSATTDLCDATAPTELTSAGGKVRIEFGGSASPTREKYGFDIKVTAA